MVFGLCYAAGCAVIVPPAALMCGRHWRLVPAADREAVLRAWRAIRAGDGQITPAFIAAIGAARRAAALAEIEIVRHG